MSDYRPDKWVIIEILNGDEAPLYKVFGSWFGGYLGSDSWRASSGVTKIDKPDEGWRQIHNFSGSIYHCHENTYGMSGYASSVLSGMIDEAPEHVKIRIVDESELMKLKGIDYGTKDTTSNG
jgi:hypothetical protein